MSILVSIPLVAQKVPPNLWYGFRTRKTLSDPSIWYRANYLGGLYLLYAGIAAVCINVVFAVTLDKVLFQIAGSFVVLITTALAMTASLIRFREL